MKNSGSMYTGNEEVRDYEYEEENKHNRKLRIIRRIGVVILLLLVFVFSFLFVRACFTDTDIVEVSENEKNLLSAAKEYYDKNYEKLPSEKGECVKVTLNTLIIDGFLKKNNYINCGGNNTYVKVCMLENKKKQWTPVLECDEIRTYFEDWQQGDVSNLVADQSDVKFKFKGYSVEASDEKLGTTEEYWKNELPSGAFKTLGETTYYRSRDKLYIWTLNEKKYFPGNAYYASSPGKGYTYKDSQTTAYKWYKEKVNKNVKYEQKKWVKQANVKVTEPYNVYGCKKNETTMNIHYGFKKCSEEKDYPVDSGVTYKACYSVIKTDDKKCYSCSIGNLKEDKSSCGYYTDWQPVDYCKVGALCKTSTGSTTTKVYYPSGSSSAAGEKAYYTSAPAGGYTHKTEGRKVYKWYKLSKTGTSSVASNAKPDANATRTNKYTFGPWSKWTTKKIVGTEFKQVQTKQKVKIQKYTDVKKEDFKEITNGYVTEKELIKAFQDKKHDVKTLKDINSNGKLKYKLQMYYRNRIEGGE